MTPAENDDTKHNPCPQSKCQILMYYADHSDNFFTNSSTFYFLPGFHNLNGTHIEVNGVVNLTLVGYDSDATERQVVPVATVQCEGKNTGFFFHNITNLSFTGLKVQDCGFNKRGKYTFMGAILMEWISNLYMSGVVIYNASGMGLHGYEVIGNSTICDTIINSSHSVMGFSQNLYLVYNNSEKSKEHSVSESHLLVKDSKFINGKNLNKSYLSFASGIDIDIRTVNRVHVALENLVVLHNEGRSGGNVAITYILQTHSWPGSVTIYNCTLAGGRALLGGGLYISLRMDTTQLEQGMSQYPLFINVIKSVFENNTAEIWGGAANIQVCENYALSFVVHVIFTECKFYNNTAASLPRYTQGGCAVNIINIKYPGYVRCRNPQYNISFVSSNFTQNSVLLVPCGNAGVFYVEENALTVLSDCIFCQ